MELRTCEYCGTEYNSSLPQCPLCGKPAAPGTAQGTGKAAAPKKGGARLVSKGDQKKEKPARDQDRIPQWMWAVICVVLGLAVLVGALYFVYIMGFFGRKSTNEAFQPSETTQQQTPEAPQPEEPEVPDEPQEPEVVKCTSLTLSQTKVTLDEKGGRIFLTAVTQPSDCQEPLTYASGDETVATVNDAGMITAVGPGETEITVACGDVTKVCLVVCEFEEETVDEPVTPDEPEEPDEPQGPAEDGSDASLSSTDFTLFHPGETTTLTVRDAPAGAAITYVSSDSSVATVSGTGLVTAVGSGTATITVTVNSTKLTCIARCNLGESTENGGGTTEAAGPCTISHSDVSLFSAGEQFTIQLTDANGDAVPGLSWSTSDSSVCTVGTGGVVTATGKGTATVSVTYGGQTYSCIVRCSFG